MDKKNETKKAVIWQRVSTKRQDLTQQKNDLIAFAESEGYKKKDLIIIEGFGASAVKQDELYKEILAELYKTLEEKPVSNVYVWEISRLARDKGRWEDLKKYLVEKQIQLSVYKPETVRLLNADGKLSRMTDIIFMFSSWVAEAEMDLKAERFSRGRQRNKELGRWNGGANGALYGYLVDEAGYILPNPEEVKIVNKIFKLYSSGKYSVASLALELKNRGMKLRGRDITDSNISNMLSNPSYIGQNEKGIKYQPIIKQAVWDKAKAVREGNDLGIRKTKESRNTNLSAKFLKCLDCGANYTASSGKYVCLRHSKPKRYTDDPCSNSDQIKVEVMDQIIWEVAKACEISSRKALNKRSLPSLVRKFEILKSKVEQMDNRFAEIEEKKRRNQKSYDNLRISEEEYNKRYNDLKIERQNLQKEKAEYLLEIVNLRIKIGQIKDGRPVDISDLDRMNQKQKREIVELHIDKAYIKKIYKGGRYMMLVVVKPKKSSEVGYIYHFTLKDRSKQIEKLLLRTLETLK